MITQDQHAQIKIALAPEDHARVRIAAALRRTSMAEFCRTVVLAEAQRLAQNIELPVKPTTLKPDPRKLQHA